MEVRTALALARDLRWAGTKDELQSYRRAEIALQGLMDRTDISAVDLQLIAQKLSQGRAPSTVNRYMAAVGVVMKQMGGPRPPRLPEPPGRERVISTEEEAEILSRMSGPERDVVVVLLDTGLRFGELRASDLQGRYLMVRESKNGKPRKVPLTDRALAAAPSRFLSYSKVRKAFKEATKGMGVTLHTLRHTCGTRLHERGVPLRVVQRWLGHRDISTTMRYAHASDEALDRAVEVL